MRHDRMQEVDERRSEEKLAEEERRQEERKWEEDKRREERERFEIMIRLEKDKEETRRWEEREREEWRRREEREREERRRDEMTAERRSQLQMFALLTAGRATLPMPPRVTVTMQPRFVFNSVVNLLCNNSTLTCSCYSSEDGDPLTALIRVESLPNLIR